MTLQKSPCRSGLFLSSYLKAGCLSDCSDAAPLFTSCWTLFQDAKVSASLSLSATSPDVVLYTVLSFITSGTLAYHMKKKGNIYQIIGWSMWANRLLSQLTLCLNNINDGCIPFRWPSSMVLVLCTLIDMAYLDLMGLNHH